MGLMNGMYCWDCSRVLENPIMCVGNHDCVRCEHCRGTSVIQMRFAPKKMDLAPTRFQQL